jgi:membrane carboxypeptidase/penicillin-binding protein PbpC
MRAVFIFVVLIIVIGLAVPVTFAVRFWMDAGSVLTRAEQSGALRVPGAGAGRLTMAERTIAMHEFRDTWRARAVPCRTLAVLWADITTDSAPQGVSVSQKFATELLSERRATSIRWQIRRFIVACQLEQRFNDRQLLRLWLARASFGQGAEGIENAAQAIFGKPSRALNAEESARLTALLRAPSLRTQPERWTERALAIQQQVAGPAR